MACGKKVPADLQPTLDSVKPEARKLAADAAKQCAAVFVSAKVSPAPLGCKVGDRSHLAELLHVPGAAKSPLVAEANVWNIEFSCHMPAEGTDGTCEVPLESMREAVYETAADVNHVPDKVDGNCNKPTTANCEQVNVPSNHRASVDALDYHIRLPVDGAPSGSFVDTVVVLAHP